MCSTALCSSAIETSSSVIVQPHVAGRGAVDESFQVSFECAHVHRIAELEGPSDRESEALFVDEYTFLPYVRRRIAFHGGRATISPNSVVESRSVTA
jgi:hypothetical protein